MDEAVRILPLLKANRFFEEPIPPRRVKDWAYRGVTIDGKVIRLRTVKVVGRRYVRREDAESFLKATSGPVEPLPPKPTRAERAEADRRQREAVEYVNSF